MNVNEFIEIEILKKFQWAVTDCVATADRWTKHVSGISFVEAGGFTYSSWHEADAIMRRITLPVAVNRAMRAAGFKRTIEPRAGDVGMVFTERGKICVAVFTGRLWFSRDEDGLIGVPPSGLWKAWRVA